MSILLAWMITCSPKHLKRKITNERLLQLDVKQLSFEQLNIIRRHSHVAQWSIALQFSLVSLVCLHCIKRVFLLLFYFLLLIIYFLLREVGKKCAVMDNVMTVNPVSLQELCVFVAAMIHYFYLVGFAWMLFEGVYLYLMVVKVFNTVIRLRLFYGVAWGKY